MASGGGRVCERTVVDGSPFALVGGWSQCDGQGDRTACLLQVDSPRRPGAVPVREGRLLAFGRIGRTDVRAWKGVGHHHELDERRQCMVRIEARQSAAQLKKIGFERHLRK